MMAPGGDWERQKVAELRRRGVPWPHVASQVGRPETSIRQLYESILPAVTPRPDPSKALAPAEPPAPTPIPWAADRDKGGNPNSPPNRALALMAHAGVTNRKVSNALSLESQAAGSLLGDLHRKGFIEPATDKHPRYWRITPAGRAKLEMARG